tara:strand:+ start:4992 stop:5789 length:798 start_codon:yes stop_codon:yes gene_type:complete
MFDDLPYEYEEFFKQNPQFADTSFLKYLFKIFQIEVSTKEYRPYWDNDKNNQLQIIFTGKPIYVSTAGYQYKSTINSSDVILKNYKFKELTRKQLKEYEEFYKRSQGSLGTNYYLYKKGELSQFLNQFKLKRYAFAYNPYVELITLQAQGRNWLINYFKNNWYRRNIEYERIYNTDLMKGYAGWKVDIKWQQKETIQQGDQRFATYVPTVYVSFIKSSTKARFMDWMGIYADYGGSNMMIGVVLNPSQQVPFMNWEIESPWREKG